MMRHALIGLAAAAFVGTTLIPGDGIADGVRHARIHVAAARAHACYPFGWRSGTCGCEPWSAWPPLAYLGAGLGPATGAATRRPRGYYYECCREPHRGLHCQYPY